MLWSEFVLWLTVGAYEAASLNGSVSRAGFGRKGTHAGKGGKDVLNLAAKRIMIKKTGRMGKDGGIPPSGRRDREQELWNYG